MESLLYLLAGGALMLAGILIGARLTRAQAHKKTEEPEAVHKAMQKDLERAKSLEAQLERIMAYDGRRREGESD